jgi:ABC-2 type transport system permease protein
VIRTFFLLAYWSLRNRMLRRLRRLREPRYAAGLVAGLLYIYFVVFRPRARGPSRGPHPFASPEFADTLPLLAVGGGVLLWVILLFAWLSPSSSPPVTFTGPEAQFLFTAPVTRRQILHYKVLRGQLGIAFAALVMMLFSGMAATGGSARWRFLVGSIIAFSTLRLHVMVVGFARATLRGPPGGRRKVLLPAAVMGALSFLIVAPFALEAPALLRLGPPGAWSRCLEILQTRPAAIGLWPFRSTMAPMFAASWRELSSTSIPALVLFALSYAWVLHADAALAEATVAAEGTRAKGGAVRARPILRRPPFALAPSGSPSVAILWKNLIMMGRYFSPRLLLMVLPLVVMLGFMATLTERGRLLAGAALFFAGFIALLGPHVLRGDLRHDLPRLALLKTWPVRGRSLIWGEILAPTVALSGSCWLLLLAALALSGSFGWSWASVVDRVTLALVAALVAPALIGAQILIQNANVVLFPAWVPTGQRRAQGIEGLGQNILLLAATLVVLVVGVFPAAAVSGLLGFALFNVIGFVGLVPAGVLFLALVLLEADAVVRALGRVLERTEPSQVEAEE